MIKNLKCITIIKNDMQSLFSVLLHSITKSTSADNAHLNLTSYCGYTVCQENVNEQKKDDFSFVPFLFSLDTQNFDSVYKHKTAV